MISGFLFLAWRIAELIFVVPIVGMLGWFVHGYSSENQLTPTTILVLFIVSCLALGWVVFTIVGYTTAKHSGLFLAFIDLCFIGAFIAGVYYLRGISHANCSNWRNDGNYYASFGIFGEYGSLSGNKWALDVNKNCAMLKASFALGIIEILLFAVTAVSSSPSSAPPSGSKASTEIFANNHAQFLALWVARHHRNDEKVVVTTRRTSSHHGHRSTSRSRSGYVSNSPRRSHHSHRSRRNYYV